ncbi:type II secretion system protein [Colwellia sp. C1TZA3]|uniref:type II secretion system protein n=1 Tax=Colwellia sp. C1TZA3 TaxID=2508879 RepID=UPI0011BA1BDC|nr:prepilin-type N-terminal cleavage/methylation domain-containing protein [Colwellia sp. C1TZA3]TWX72712.1 prepilin-type N-terminal cleavage/methylation domain-containing protein [Colwellia sp. C1TZA3]
MYFKGFTLIELVVVIVILGILAATAAPKFINLNADAQTATLQGVMAAMQGAAARVYSKSLVKGNQNIADGTITHTDGELAITYGYPKADIVEWQRLIGLDAANFKYLLLAGTVTIYLADATRPSNITDACLVYYAKPTAAGSAPSFILNECV